MDPLTFTARLIDALAWPMATIALVALLRREIRALLPLVRKVKAGPVEAEFERGTERLGEKLPEQPKVAEVITHDKDAERHLPVGSARGAVLEAWLRLEAAANEALTRVYQKRIDANAMLTQPTTHRLPDVLRDNGLLNEGQGNLMRELIHLRNEVVHTHEFSPTHEALIRYRQTADYLTWWLQEAVKK